MVLPLGNISRRDFIPFSEYNTSLSQSLSAMADEAATQNPIASIIRSYELSGALEDEDKIEAAEARRMAEAMGLEINFGDAPISRTAVDIMLNRARQRKQRQVTMALGPQGIVPGALSFGTAFAVGMVDPLNVASAFVPIVGPARYARALGRAGSALGRAGVRARVGAVEGAAGAALLEPVVAYANIQEGQDYGMADVMANLAFGAAFGAVLHTFGGAVGDLVARGSAVRELVNSYPAGVRADVLRGQIAALTESGRGINVETFLQAGAERDLRVREIVAPNPIARSPETFLIQQGDAGTRSYVLKGEADETVAALRVEPSPTGAVVRAANEMTDRQATSLLYAAVRENTEVRSGPEASQALVRAAERLAREGFEVEFNVGEGTVQDAVIRAADGDVFRIKSNPELSTSLADDIAQAQEFQSNVKTAMDRLRKDLDQPESQMRESPAEEVEITEESFQAMRESGEIPDEVAAAIDRELTTLNEEAALHEQAYREASACIVRNNG